MTPFDAAEWHQLSRSAAQTEAVGARLAAALPPAEHGPAVIDLSGDLGAGKTTLARGFLRQLGWAEPVRSPTFTLLECYECSDVVVVHADLYRVRDAAELDLLGLRDLARAGHVWLIEWPERGAGHLPPCDLRIHLVVAAEGHPLSIAARSPLGQRWLARAVELSREAT